MMKVRLLSLISIVLFFFSCANTNTASTTIPKTYAEISVKEGGSWNGKKYEGGHFKNVSSMSLHPNHTDHSFDIRYEGPGWENNKIGYRLYLDWRNAIDIYGKLTDEMVLSKVGLDGFDSYHNMNDWGADILKVGKGLGIGSIGRISNKEVLHFNEVEKTEVKIQNLSNKSNVLINYKGWKTNNQSTNFTSRLTIFPNQRYTQHTIQSSNALDGICTGIVNLYGLPMIKKISDSNNWAYLATYGKQTLFNDNLGMAILYKVDKVENVFKGEYDYLLQFKPTTDAVTFYFLGAWEKEVDGIKSEVEFIKYLDNLLNILDNSNNLN
jgi:hypothetical protein